MSWYNPLSWGRPAAATPPATPLRQAVQQQQNAAQMRTYLAAEQDRITSSWSGSALTADEEILRSLRMLRNRSRQLAMDNDYAGKFLHMVRSNVVGQHGIKLQAKAKRPDGTLDRADNKAIEDAWRRWGKRGNCTADGKLSWRETQALIAESIARDGEALVRLVTPFDNEFNFALHVEEADFLDEQLNRRQTPAGTRIRLGVEQDQWGKPLGYHLLTVHPGDNIGMTATRHMRVAAAELLHLYVMRRAGQSRGVPWMHAGMRHQDMLYGYLEAELVAARAGSSTMGVIETPAGEFAGNTAPTAQGQPQLEMAPGSIPVLAAGQKFEGFDPDHPTTAFGGFVKSVLRGIAAGLNVSYHSLANDLESINFSSSRAGILEEREHWKLLQGWLVEALCQPVFNAWLPNALLMGAITNDNGLPLPSSKLEKFNAVVWQGRGWSWVDPLKDQMSNGAAVAAGHKTNSEVVAERGGDLEEIYQRLAEERALAEQFGLQLQLTPAQTGISVGTESETETAPTQPQQANPAAG